MKIVAEVLVSTLDGCSSWETFPVIRKSIEEARREFEEARAETEGLFYVLGHEFVSYQISCVNFYTIDEWFEKRVSKSENKAEPIEPVNQDPGDNIPSLAEVQAISKKIPRHIIEEALRHK